MTRQYSCVVGVGTEAANSHRRALASIPNHFRIVETGPADVVLWGHRADADLASARAVVLDDLLAAPAAASSARLVIPALRFLPLLSANGLFELAAGRKFTSLELNSTVPVETTNGLALSLLEQLAILRILSGSRASVAMLNSFGTGYLSIAKLGHPDTAVSLSAVLGGHDEGDLSVQAVSPTERIEAHIGAGATARPASIVHFDSKGSSQTIPLRQNSLRLTWLSAHEVLSDGGATVPYDLSMLLDDLATVRGALV